jgi:hypothetical protein
MVFTLATVAFRVLVFGSTDAFIADTCMQAELADREITEADVFGMPISIPSVVSRETPINEQSVFVLPFVNPGEIQENVRNGDKFLNVSGHILYRDVFDQSHETVFCLTWKSEYSALISMWSDRWVKAGNSKQNQET